MVIHRLASQNFPNQEFTERKNMKISNSWKIRLSVVALGTVLLGLPLGPVAAQADASDPCLFSNTLCLFERTEFGGERFTVAPLTPGQGVCVDLVEHGWGGRASSATNTSTSSNAMFQSDDCTGQPMEIPTGPTPHLSFSPNSVFVS
ncbi:peptidase inhibitor family I36 protein [Nocardiopsis dassonvillei]|uniref:peptidase inhibitor family I36 protein n=1 Tax=Nocardiopsis dassonvillei TaxID=2014 RepID=UPI0033DA5A4B